MGLTSVEIATDGLGKLNLAGSSRECGAYAASGLIRNGETFLAGGAEQA